MIDENAEPASRCRPEIAHDGNQVVDAVEIFDNNSLKSKVISPDLLDQLRIVAALDVDAALARHPRQRAANRHRPRGRVRFRDRTGCGWANQGHRHSIEEETGGRQRKHPVSYTHLTLPTIYSV